MHPPRILLFALIAFWLGFTATPGRAADDYRATLSKEGRTLELQISSDFSTGQRDNLLAWIDYISASLLQVYGHWPRQTWRISVAPASAAGGDPIPWAQVNRGDVDTVEFFVAPQASPAQLKQAWTGYHELAHLLIPYRGWGDHWFSEGLASFYQNILQARAGVLSEQQAWQRMYEGFMRGRADAAFDGQPLSQVSAAMREQGGFMRVYWSGAWYFLASDLRLRQQSGGKMTLDLALRKLNDCCADARLSVPEIVNKLDELNGVLLFEPLYRQLNESTAMPAFENSFASLGIAIIDGEVSLQQAGPGAALRQQMLQRRL
jgi:hypothetical protein